MVEDRRTKVRHPEYGVGAIEKVLSTNYCSGQFDHSGFYRVCKIDDLEPATEEEFRRKFK